MRGGIRGCRNGVDAFADDLSLFDNDSAEWAATPDTNIFGCQGDGAPHEIFVLIICHTVFDLQQYGMFIRGAGPVWDRRGRRGERESNWRSATKASSSVA